MFPCQAASQEAQHETVASTPSDSLALIQNEVDNQLRSTLVTLASFAAPFFGQPGDGATQHCPADPTIDSGSCPKVDAGSLGKYVIGHIPPFVALAAVNMAYQDESSRICHDWLDHNTNRCDTKKSVLDESVFKYFGTKEGKIDFLPPICIDSEASSTYYLLEYGAVSRLCYRQLPLAALLY